MRISDWSSDVCSSDLPLGAVLQPLSAPWTPLAASLLSLQASRERPPGTDPETAGVTLFSRAAADCERALFDADAPAAGGAKGADTVGAVAQDKFPSDSIEIVSHASPGGGTDITARMWMDEAAKILGRSEEHTSDIQSLMRI